MQGICFVEPLFHKVVKQEKTQTRRIVPMPKWAYALEMGTYGLFAYDANENTDAMRIQYLKPKYKVDEIVYLKEPYVITGKHIIYKFGSTIGRECDKAGVKWSNKLFMPESAAHYFIKITAVRAERLQDITEEDCLKEGIEKNVFKGEVLNIPEYFNGYITVNYPKEAYAGLINIINRKDIWGSNPFVWVYDFELYQS